ncbi:EAL domain-containing protein [Mesorhizobium sp.]|uniref:EAL domain-containing protein n=1 Tax=Mesorhizobium sp. TaxID=1871066 RepID=UPI000FE62434|nr:EAL domain-containing protein [Mesorhizobium sp.]RWB71621.1 MAG: EAL domain-containing protein [Mesorhizobium sp.]
MATKPSRGANEAPERAELAALAKLATASYETLERELRARITALESQALRFETAIDNISLGICFFGVDERIILCNRRYAEIYGIAPGALQPGMTLREIIELRVAAGTSVMPTDAYLEAARSVNKAGEPRTWNARLSDGRTIEVRHQPMPDGGWVATHEDITELIASRQFADERISLQALIDWVPDYLWIKSADGRFVVANKALATDSGREKTSDMIGLSDFDLHAPEMARSFHDSEQRILRSGEPMIDEEEFVVDASGAGKWVSSTKVPLRNSDGETLGLLGIAHDITARKRADVLRDGQAHILEMIATGAPLEDVLDKLMLLVESQLHAIFGSVLLLDKSGRLRHGSAPSLAKDYTSAIDGSAIGPKAGSCGTAAYRREPVFVTDITQDPLWEGYRHLVAPYGYRSCWSTPILSHQGAVLGVFAMYSMTAREPTAAERKLIEFTTHIAGIAIERKLSVEQIHFMANHDALTGLPNRALLEDRLSQSILYAQRYGRWITILFIDLDNFKLVNDTLGHNAGDELLKTVASRMVQCVTLSDTVVRLGGDEFVVVLSDQPTNLDHASEMVRRIQVAIAAPIQLGGHRLRTTASIGVANYPKDGTSLDALLANADAAMYSAKEFGRDNFQFYAPEFNIRAHEKFVLREELRNALARSEFMLLYQPQLDLRTGRIFAVEALVRWKHPTRGMVSPRTFIPTAEESGLIVQIGDWVLQEACRQNKAWQNAGLPPIAVCVNVSARQFREKNLVARVVKALADSGLEARYLELEVTESLIMQDVDLAVSTMNELQALGVQISIDDFGTGYSSLSSLKTFPVARLKIDKSFINDLAADENDQAVASAVISLGQKLNLRVIAEGVETDDQVAFLRKNNCDEMQGYHFSKPIGALEIEKMLGGGRKE